MKKNKVIKTIVLVAVIIVIIFLCITKCSKNNEIGTDTSDNNKKQKENIVLKLNKDEELVLEVGSDYIEYGAEATKAGMDVSNEIKVINNDVNVEKIGTYYVVYEVTDKYGNKNEIKRKITIIDTTKPEIVLNGNNIISIIKNQKYEELGASAIDNYDKEINSKVKIDGSVDTSKIGKYTITYTVADSSNNTSSITRIINVIEIGNPILTLKGTGTVYLEVGSNYIESGYKAECSNDGDLTNKVKVSGEVNTNKLGTYEKIYTVTNSGNKTATVKRTIIVRDTTLPIITLNGSNSVKIYVGDNYNEEGAIATDNYDNDITSKIIKSGDVDTDVIGVYYVYYDVTDNSGNKATVQRKVVVTRYSETKKVNIPQLLTGMKAIKFDDNGLPADATTTDVQSSNWYDYKVQGSFLTDGKTSRWANVMTEDGSMWVWIPRYAYRFIYYIDDSYTTTSSSKTKFGKIEIVFLKDKSDKYDKDGTEHTAKRAGDPLVMSDYIVHPAFTDESSINYANGGWDSELAGIWIAKFQAGFVDKGDSNLKDTAITYTGTSASTNYYYTTITSGVTLLKYPIFKPNVYSYNTINIGDTYALSKALTSLNNPYGFTSVTADTHLLKNSEWGAVTYLAYSQYGRNGNQITINNCNSNNAANKVYAVTGIGGDTVSAASANNMANPNNQYNGIYGKLASTTGNVYGVYDMSGGLYEETAAYLNNGNVSLNDYGKVMVDDGGNVNTKYKSLYQVATDDINVNNYATGVDRLGEAIWETSVSIGTNGSWFDDYSAYLRTNAPFLQRGGYYTLTTAAGGFAFSMTSGVAGVTTGFRTVISPR